MDLTLSVVDVVLVVVGPTAVRSAAFDDLDGVVLGVPPTTHDARTNLQRKDRRLSLLRYVRLQRPFVGRSMVAIDGLGLSIAVACGSGRVGVSRAVLCTRRCSYRTHCRLTRGPSKMWYEMITAGIKREDLWAESVGWAINRGR